MGINPFGRLFFAVERGGHAKQPDAKQRDGWRLRHVQRADTHQAHRIKRGDVTEGCR